MHNEETLRAMIDDAILNYGDAIQGSDEDYFLKDFVIYLVSEIMNDSDRTEVKEAIDNINLMKS